MDRDYSEDGRSFLLMAFASGVTLCFVWLVGLEAAIYLPVAYAALSFFYFRKDKKQKENRR